jgi:two-component system sensor histidine kinase KdpD
LLTIALIIALVTVAAYFAHAKSFVAGFLYLLPVMLIAFRWGLIDASIASVLAVGCLDYFFTEPLFHFYMADPQDWLALVSFEALVLLVSQLASHLKRHALESAQQRQHVETLYLVSRDVLLLNLSGAIGSQLVHLIVNAFGLSGASLWDSREARVDIAGRIDIREEEVRATFLHRGHVNDGVNSRFLRTLFVGTRAIGAIGIEDSSSNKVRIDARTADAIASLAALALERSHSFKAESGAEAARQSEQLRSALLDGLAHAFKTPLATIQGASSGLLEIGSLTSAQEDLVSLINQESIRLGDLTTQALQTARIDGDHLDVKKEELVVRLLFEDIAEHYSHYFSGHHLHIGTDTRVTVWADKRLLRLALLELVDNASKYADPRAPIRLCASYAGLEVCFSVQNEGSYIDPQERVRIFRRFYRSPGSQHRAAGTGIGLSFVTRIAEAHSGHVWVESEATTGTTFFLALPVSTKEIENGHKHRACFDC